MVPPSQVARNLALLTLALAALFFVTMWAMGWFRRHYLLRNDEEEEEPAYDITQLREMYEDGIITGEEFERLKEKIYGRRSYRP